MCDKQFLSTLGYESINGKNLDELKPEDLRPRYTFNDASFPQLGLVPLEFMNLATAIYYSGSGFDLGNEPYFSSNTPIVPSFESDAVCTMFASAYVGLHTLENKSISEHANNIYNNWVTNYLYWRSTSGKPLMKDNDDIEYDFKIVSFMDLSTFDLTKFHFIARLTALLDVTILSSVTKDQMKMYAELCLCAAENDVIYLSKNNLS
jgi:hypothetical protein